MDGTVLFAVVAYKILKMYVKVVFEWKWGVGFVLMMGIVEVVFDLVGTKHFDEG